MTKKQIMEWYEIQSDDVRMRLLNDFDKIYDNLGSRETKFYTWLKQKIK
jgi:hypothetical protein